MEDLGDIEQTDDVAIFVADRLITAIQLEVHWRKGGSAYEMPEMLGDHEFEGLGRAGGITGDHWVTRHDLADRRRMRIEPFSSDLSCTS